MKLVIVTGLSGAGKSRAIAAFEDIDYYCVDNMPIDFIPKFVDICCQSGSKIQKVAIVTDIRSSHSFDSLLEDLKVIKASGAELSILFIDSNTDVIIRRYKETRRKHPLAEEYKGPEKQLIEYERELLQPLQDQADFIIDTSYLTSAQLKDQITKIFSEGKKAISVTVQSFGFKYGISTDSDMVFDVRCLPNPFYIEGIRHLSGLDEPIIEYVFRFKQTREYVKKIKDMLGFLMPLFIEEGKSSLVIGIGCTGGRHRSVAIAEEISSFLKETGIDSSTYHRDMIKSEKRA